MREIKFRIYHNNQMHFNAIVGNGQVLYIPGATGEYKWVNEAECKVMQFTGLLDKNGKEIYEGDVVQFGCIGVVKYSEDRYYVECEDSQMRVSKHSEVIGNIYQNPELLKP